MRMYPRTLKEAQGCRQEIERLKHLREQYRKKIEQEITYKSTLSPLPEVRNKLLPKGESGD